MRCFFSLFSPSPETGPKDRISLTDKQSEKRNWIQYQARLLGAYESNRFPSACFDAPCIAATHPFIIAASVLLFVVHTAVRQLLLLYAVCTSLCLKIECQTAPETELDSAPATGCVVIIPLKTCLALPLYGERMRGCSFQSLGCRPCPP